MEGPTQSESDALRRRPGLARDEEVDSIPEVVPKNIFDDNNQGLIDNPLLHWSPAELERRTRQVAQDHGLANHQELFIKAAHILRDPEAWPGVPNLTESEKVALKHEKANGFWRQPKELRVTIIMLCVAAVVQGWNQTASNGANLHWPHYLGLTNLRGCQPVGREAWIFAIVNASSYLAASLIGCWLSDPINEYFLGRRAAICVSASLILAASIGSALTQHWRQLLACRVILGIGMGCKAAVVPVFAAEVAPAHIRGSLVMNWQLFDAFGIFLGYTANLIVSGVGRYAWRWQTASSVLPTIVLLSLIFVCPDSPRFLMKHQRYQEAYRALLAMRGEPLLAAKELLYVHFQMDVETRFFQSKQPSINADALNEDREKGRLRPWRWSDENHSIHYWQKLGQLFTVKRIRRAMISAIVCMVGQQLVGVNVLSFYSSTFFCDASDFSSVDTGDRSYVKPLLLSWGTGLINFLFALPAYRLIDKRGRRWLLLMTLPFLALTMLATALSFQIPTDNPAHIPAIALFTYLFMVFYSPGMGPVPFTMSAEVFPLSHRLVGMSFAVFANMLGAGLLTLFVPALTIAIGHSGILGIFAGLNVLTFVLVFLFVRETAGTALGGIDGSMTFMSLEELNYIFGVSTKKHVTYQLTSVLPWVWKYYIKRDKKGPDQPENLYTWAEPASKFDENEGAEGVTAYEGA